MINGAYVSIKRSNCWPTEIFVFFVAISENNEHWLHIIGFM